ncbi:ubiquitin carboxyl-terminal hydrolase 48-like isoform X2 [Embiotoca jacksoni]|uniref:ubiquitin carboxyl-terminal hydrolase 48-like isoform X2 n=1 Tax=Embiotoca jacksoni TaxID=100190 RepID=UPI0037040C1C
MCDYLMKMFRDKLENLSISDYHGLNSPGLTCYLNSVLQVLFMTKDFREAVKRCCSQDSTTIDQHLRELFHNLGKRTARTHDVILKLGITDVYEQRDAAEYLEKILCLTSPEASKMFKGELNHKTTCGECNKRNDCRSLFWILPLAVEDSRSKTFNVEGLQAFFRAQRLSGDDRMYCERCDEKRDADTEWEITQHPDVLTLLLKRFTFDDERRCFVKLHCRAAAPRTLHLEKYVYDLYAVVNHFGTLSGGHYMAEIRSFETGWWYCFDDGTVKRSKPELLGDDYLRSCTAYLLMYRKSAGEEEERGEALPPPHHHQLKDHRGGGMENSEHVEGDALKKNPVGRKRTDSSGELDKDPNRRSERFTRTRRDGDQQEIHRPQLDTCHRYTTATPAVHLSTRHVEGLFEKKVNSKKRRAEVNWTSCETTDDIIQKTSPSDRSTARKTIKSNKRARHHKEAAADGGEERYTEHADVKSCHVCSSSSVSHLTTRWPGLRGAGRPGLRGADGPGEASRSSNLCRKSSFPGNKEKIVPVDSGRKTTGMKRQKTQRPRETKTEMRKPWKS